MSPTPTSRPRGPKAQRVDTAKILDAAQDAFSEVGLQGSSIRAIAQRAGCDPALIYYHFESKETMFLALLDRKIPPLAEALERITLQNDARPLPVRLWDVLRVFRKYFGADPGFRAVLRGEIVRGAENTREPIAQRLRRVSSCLWTLLEQGKARGEIRADLDPHLGGFFFIKLYLEILEVVPTMFLVVTGRDPAQALNRAEHAWIEIFWRGIASDPNEPLPHLPDLEDLP